MIKIFFILVSLLFVGFGANAQFTSQERSARKNLSKQNWTKAHDQLRKILQRDSASASSEFLLAIYFFSRFNPHFSIDSAHTYLAEARRHLATKGPKEQERLRRIPLDTTILAVLQEQIDSAAFTRAKLLNTEAAFLFFISEFPNARQQTEAIALRDKAAYLDAVKLHTYEGYFSFLEKYPDAEHAEEARSKYHLLVFETKTKAKTLNAYEQFLREYPSTPYRNVAEKNIFEIATASGRKEDFLAYLERYPGSSFARKARNILFHLTEDSDSVVHPFFNDSLRNIHYLNHNYMVPVLRNGKYGFIDHSGKMILAPEWSAILSEYKCGNVTDDLLLLDSMLTSRDGNVIYRNPVRRFEDIGYGFILIGHQPCNTLIHKSGFVANGCIKDARIINGRFIALRGDTGWSLSTLAGRQITKTSWDSIYAINDVLAFRKDQGIELVRSDVLAGTVNQEPLHSTAYADSVAMWPEEIVWTRTGKVESLYDQNLTTVIEGEKIIRPIYFGALIVGINNNIRFWSRRHKVPEQFDQYHLRDPWVTFRQDSSWRIYQARTGTIHDTKYDTAWFNGPFVIGKRMDSVDVYFPNNSRIAFSSQVKLSFLPGKDSLVFLSVQLDRKKTLYGFNGDKYFVTEYDDIQYAGEKLFLVTAKGRKGLIGRDGRILLPVEYDAIGAPSNGVVSLLKNSRFGAFNINQRKIIKPQYEKNLIPYGGWLAAFSSGKYRFITWDNKPSHKIEFDQLWDWTDSVALVKNNFQWRLFNLKTSKAEETDITNIQYVNDTPASRTVILKQDNQWGVLNNVKGFIIPTTFTEVVNVGTAEKPLYFTEKHVEEASIFVVIYYSASGKMLLRHVYEEDEYARIHCIGE